MYGAIQQYSNEYGRLCKKEMVLKRQYAKAYGVRLDLGLDEERGGGLQRVVE